MDIASGVLQLSGVALGGLIAAMTARSPRVRDSRTEGLRLLMRVRGMLHSFDIIEVGDGDGVFSELRIALAGARIPWALIDEHQNVALDSINEANAIKARLQSKDAKLPEGDLIELLRDAHPAYLFSRPSVKYSELLGRFIREELERPIYARIRRPWRSRYLRRIRKDLPDSYRERRRQDFLQRYSVRKASNESD